MKDLTLQDAKDLFATGNPKLREMALEHYSEADINPDYEPPYEEPKFDINKDLPTTWEGATKLLDMVTRCGFMLCHMSLDKNKSGWADHVYTDSDIANEYVHLSTMLLISRAWWKVDYDWNKWAEIGHKLDCNYIDKDLKIKHETKYVHPICFRTKELAEKFLKLFRDTLEDCKIFL